MYYSSHKQRAIHRSCEGQVEEWNGCASKINSRTVPSLLRFPALFGTTVRLTRTPEPDRSFVNLASKRVPPSFTPPLASLVSPIMLKKRRPLVRPSPLGPSLPPVVRPGGPPPPKPPKPVAKKPSRKGKERAIETDDESGDYVPPPPRVRPGQSKLGKRVRIAAGDSSEDEEPGSDEDASSDEDDDTGDEGDDSSAVEDELFAGKNMEVEGDWTDPKALPYNARYRGGRELKLLDYGAYRTALHDVATNEMGLDHLLLGWEELRQRRLAVELLATAEEGSQAGSDNDDEGDDSDDNRRHKRIRRIEVPSLSPGATPSNDPPAPIPLPSALTLAESARWPVPLAEIASAAPQTTLDDFLFDFLARTSRQASAVNSDVAHPQPRPPKMPPRSAYEQDGPLCDVHDAYDGSALVEVKQAGLGDAESLQEDDSSADEDDSTSLTSSLDIYGPFDAPPAILKQRDSITASINQLLAGLLDKTPLRNIPPLDHWDQVKRDDPVGLGEKSLGWEHVVEVIRGMEGVPLGYVSPAFASFA